jgi:outer membrane receptor for ferric coprogen and ferric-rhodotorulic acid
VLWGALPLTYSDGTRIDYPVSASTSADWTYWNVTDQSAFAELDYAFGGGWSAKGVLTYKRFDEHAKLLYAYGYPDKATGLGVKRHERHLSVDLRPVSRRLLRLGPGQAVRPRA